MCMPRRRPRHLEGELFTIAPVGGDQQPFVATITPVTPPEPEPTPPEPEVKWVYSEGKGWYLAFGPCQKPQPVPPDVPEGGNWTYNGDGWYYVLGPYDKPQPGP